MDSARSVVLKLDVQAPPTAADPLKKLAEEAKKAGQVLSGQGVLGKAPERKLTGEQGHQARDVVLGHSRSPGEVSEDVNLFHVNPVGHGRPLTRSSPAPAGRRCSG